MVAVPKPWFLGSRLWCWNLGSKGPDNQHRLGRTILGTLPLQLRQWHHCDLVRPGWLFITSKTTTAWWLASNLRSMPLAMTSQINDQDPRQGIFHLPQHKAGSPWNNNGVYLKLRSLTFLHCTSSVQDPSRLMVAVPEFWFLHSRLCNVKICAQMFHMTTTALNTGVEPG